MLGIPDYVSLSLTGCLSSLRDNALPAEGAESAFAGGVVSKRLYIQTQVFERKDASMHHQTMQIRHFKHQVRMIVPSVV